MIIPSSVNIELTNACNLKCSMCSRTHNQFNIGYMDFDKLKTFIFKYKNILSFVCLSVFGESFLHPKLTDIVKFIKNQNRNIKIMIATNATLPNTIQITKDIADDIDNLMISIDGVGATYDHIRRGANYEAYGNNITEISRIMSSKNVYTYFNVVVTKENYKDIKEIIILANKLKFNVRLSPINIIALPDDSYATDIYEFYLSPTFNNVLDTCMKLAQELNVEVMDSFFVRSKDRNIEDCVYLYNGFTIAWNGEIPICCNKCHTDINIGNAFTDDFLECVNGNIFNQIRSLAKKGIVTDHCKKCGDYNYKGIINANRIKNLI